MNRKFVAGAVANILVVVALTIVTPFYILCGILSDRIGRKPILLAGFALAAVTFFPLFEALTGYANPDLVKAQHASPIVVTADQRECSLQFNPVGTAKFTSSCDVARSALSKAGLNYTNVPTQQSQVATITVGDIVVQSFDATASNAKELQGTFDHALTAALTQKGYPSKPDPAKVNKPMVVLILVVMMLYGVLVYAPLAAILVELFPSRIRYTSMSLPYNIGNGWFGGFLPASVFAIVATTGDMYAGLWYPVMIAVASFVIALLFLRETKTVDISRID